MKQKILAELKKKFPGLSTEFLGFIASKLEPKVTEDTQIEGAITELDTVLPIKEQADFFQSESDRRVSDAKKKFEAEKPKPKDEKKDDEPKDDELEIKSVLKQLNDRLDAYEAKERISKANEAFKTQVAAKGIPLKFLKGRTVESEEQIEAAIAEVESDYEELKQEIANEGFKGQNPPKSGQGKPNQLASKEEVAEVVNSIM